MIRVLEVLGRSAGGVARHVAQITSGLSGNTELHIEVAGPSDLPVPIQNLEHEVVIPDGPLRGHRAAIARLRAIIEDFRPDLVHAHGLRAGIDASYAVGEVPLVLSVHNLVRADISGALRAVVFRRAESLAVRRAGKVLAPSAEIARHLAATVSGSAAKIEVLYLGVGEAPPQQRGRDAVRAELQVDDGPLAVTAARLHPQKDLPTMLRAVAASPGLQLVVLGDGPLRSNLEEMATRLGIAQRVRFVGFRDDVFDVLRAADVFVLTSVWEAVALAVQEAVLVKTPVVATDTGGIPELIEDSRSGWLVSKGDHEGFAAAMGDVLSNPDEASRRADEAYARLRTTFSTDAMLDRLAEIYGSLGR
jgi:glycosyltransferase involved in cell wall biosynthesis